MKIAIMQPYFFPYLGYFQLINSADIFVNLEHVSFIKRGYMTNNQIKNNIRINIPVSYGSQNKLCNEVFVLSDKKWFDSFFKKLEYYYKKEKNYEAVLSEILNPWRSKTEGANTSISNFNFESIKLICNYLSIDTKLESSLGITKNKKEFGLIDITKKFGCDTYINAIGGQKIYKKEDFENNDVNLYFLKMIEHPDYYPYVSILDLLFRYDEIFLKKQLNNYILL